MPIVFLPKLTIMASVDPAAVPYLNDTLLMSRLQPAKDIIHGDDEEPTKTYAMPEGEVYNLNNRIMRRVHNRFRDLVMSTVYPYGYDPIVGVIPPTKLINGKGKKRKLPDKLWRKVFHRVSRKRLGRRIEPSMSAPKLKKLIKAKRAKGLTARGLTARGLTARGLTARGLTARGIRARGLPPIGPMTSTSAIKPQEELEDESSWTWTDGRKYVTSGIGMAPHSANPEDFVMGQGPILEAVSKLVGPVVVQGLSSLGNYIGKKIKEKRERAAEKEARIAKAEAELPETRKRLEKDVQERMAQAQAHIAELKAKKAAEAPEQQGTGKIKRRLSAYPVPTPYQLEQMEKSTKRARKQGKRAVENPLSYPVAPVPRNAISMLRDGYNKAKATLYDASDMAGIEPKSAAPIIHKVIQKHAKHHLGKKLAKDVLSPSGKGLTCSGSGPIKAITSLINRILGQRKGTTLGTTAKLIGLKAAEKGLEFLKSPRAEELGRTVVRRLMNKKTEPELGVTSLKEPKAEAPTPEQTAKGKDVIAKGRKLWSQIATASTGRGDGDEPGETKKAEEPKVEEPKIEEKATKSEAEVEQALEEEELAWKQRKAARKAERERKALEEQELKATKKAAKKEAAILEGAVEISKAKQRIEELKEKLAALESQSPVKKAVPGQRWKLVPSERTESGWEREYYFPSSPASLERFEAPTRQEKLKRYRKWGMMPALDEEVEAKKAKKLAKRLRKQQKYLEKYGEEAPESVVDKRRLKKRLERYVEAPMHLGIVGPTTASTLRGAKKAYAVMELGKKIEETM